MNKLAEQFQNDILMRYQEKLAGLMEKDAVSLGKWLGAYGNRLKDVISGTNYGAWGNTSLKSAPFLVGNAAKNQAIERGLLAPVVELADRKFNLQGLLDNMSKDLDRYRM